VHIQQTNYTVHTVARTQCVGRQQGCGLCGHCGAKDSTMRHPATRMVLMVENMDLARENMGYIQPQLMFTCPSTDYFFMFIGGARIRLFGGRQGFTKYSK